MLSWLLSRPVRECHRLTHPARRTAAEKGPRAPPRPATSWRQSDISKNEMAISADSGGTLVLRHEMDRLEEHAWAAEERSLGSWSTWNVMSVGWYTGRDAAASRGVKGDEHQVAQTARSTSACVPHPVGCTQGRRLANQQTVAAPSETMTQPLTKGN